MSKEVFVMGKINDYYKGKTRDKKIKEKYNKKSQGNAIIYRYRELSEVRPIYKILNSLSTRINKKLKELNINREFTYTQILGCNVNELEEYLLKKMTKEMSFDNYRKWEVDHIMPFSSFDFHNLQQIKNCCHYSNLQPLWQKDNQQKSNKITPNPRLAALR